MSDALYNVVKSCTIIIIDDYNREALFITIKFSIPSTFVTSLIDDIAITRGYQNNIRVDNGREFISKHLMKWAVTKGIRIHHIQPGKPAQNAFIEKFNKTY